MKDKIEKLFSACKASVHITYNMIRFTTLLSKRELEDIDKDVSYIYYSSLLFDKT